ncbi:MAG: sodium:solute symporter family protein [Gemmatimonadota bacterium]
MQLNTLDWTVLAAYLVIAVSVGLYFARRAGSDTSEFFLAGRTMPWWLLGTSMVATTFSTDTPNLVADLVRSGGVSQNWAWWAFLLTGMATVFFYARLWRRSDVFTDVGFYELRYSGRPAAFLRGFRALYLGVFFNVVIMATVTLAAIKIGGVLLGADKYEVVLVAGALTVLYSATSGLWGVVVTDLLLFVIAMIGAVAAAYYALGHPDVGGLAGLVSHPDVAPRLSFLPDFTDWSTAAAVFIVPIAVQWWSTWYPGSEPGGGGYAAQRMLAARDESHALKATLWFNVAHYAVRPWPWILVGLASLIVYPDLASILAAFPDVDPTLVGNDMAYPAMLVFVPHGLLGLVAASLAAAYMSTISTHLNWGASYVVDDFYRRFVARERTEAAYVRAGRLATVGLIVLASIVALWLENALQAFQLMLQIGAGTGLVFLLRWFWWRINAWSEISAMVVSFVVAVIMQYVDLNPSLELVIGVAVTSVGWLAVTFLTQPDDEATLRAFHKKIRPIGPGWRAVVGRSAATTDGEGSFATPLLAWFLGCVLVYAALFGTGLLLYGQVGRGLVALTIAAAATVGVFRLLPSIRLVD